MTQEQNIRELLAAYGGDKTKAIAAVRAYKPRPATSIEKFLNKPVVISLAGVSKQYKLKKQIVRALDGVDLQIHQGEFVAITGASGSGKSTLLQLIGGLDKPSTGNVSIDGVNINTLSDSKLSTLRNSTIGFVFQFFYLQPFLTVNKNIEVPGMFAGSKPQKRRHATEKLLAAVGLDDRGTHLPNQLSGGQLQRAAISRALLNNPKILLADEPTGNLDSKNSAAIIDLFEAIRDEFGVTVVLVTHDSSIAARADRTIVMHDGAII